MGLRLEALKKFFMTDRMIASSIGRKVRKDQRGSAKLKKDLAMVDAAERSGETDTLLYNFTKYVTDAENELEILDQAMSAVFIVKQRNIKRIQVAIINQKDPKKKEQLKVELNEIRSQIAKWFKILQGNKEGGRLQLIKMDESTLAQESVSISKVYRRYVGKLKRDEKKVAKSASDKDMNTFDKDLHYAEDLENKLFEDLENLTLLQEQMEATELQTRLDKLKTEDYPEYARAVEARTRLAVFLGHIFDSQITRLNTLIKTS